MRKDNEDDASQVAKVINPTKRRGTHRQNPVTTCLAAADWMEEEDELAVGSIADKYVKSQLVDSKEEYEVNNMSNDQRLDRYRTLNLEESAKLLKDNMSRRLNGP